MTGHMLRYLIILDYRHGVRRFFCLTKSFRNVSSFRYADFMNFDYRQTPVDGVQWFSTLITCSASDRLTNVGVSISDVRIDRPKSLAFMPELALLRFSWTWMDVVFFKNVQKSKKTHF